jgi:hypothetical protein
VLRLEVLSNSFPVYIRQGTFVFLVKAQLSAQYMLTKQQNLLDLFNL